jgi:sec-independent protein translocase protein TatC
VEKKNIYEHIDEVRKIVIKSLLAIGILSILAYVFKDRLLVLLTRSLDRELVFLLPTEPLVTLIKLSIIVGFILAFPYVLLQIWEFVMEIFNKKDRKKIVKYLFFSLVLFYGAIIFCYLFVLPIVVDFLINFGSPSLIPSLTFSNYLNFVTSLLLGFGLIFQMPLVLLALINLNIVSVDYLKKKRIYVILIVFIIASLLTPPDGISLLLLALPLIILFEVTLLIARSKAK